MAKTNYRERFEQHIPPAYQALVEIAPDLPDVLPGLSLPKSRRVFRSLIRLLERVDRGDIRFPEFLATETGTAAEDAINLTANVPALTANGAQYFVSNGLAKLVELEGRITRALGSNARAVRDLKDQQLIELHSVLESSQVSLADMQRMRRKVTEDQKKIDRLAELTAISRSKAAEDAEVVKNTREAAKKLADGDARRGDSLEKYIRLARAKNEEFEKLAVEITQASNRSVALAGTIEGVTAGAQEGAMRLSTIEARANAILKGATQAGLAGSYVGERNRLYKEQMIFAGIFYTINLLIVLRCDLDRSRLFFCGFKSPRRACIAW